MLPFRKIVTVPNPAKILPNSGQNPPKKSAKKLFGKSLKNLHKKENFQILLKILKTKIYLGNY